MGLQGQMQATIRKVDAELLIHAAGTSNESKNSLQPEMTAVSPQDISLLIATVAMPFPRLDWLDPVTYCLCMPSSLAAVLLTADKSSC